MTTDVEDVPLGASFAVSSPRARCSRDRNSGVPLTEAQIMRLELPRTALASFGLEPSGLVEGPAGTRPGRRRRR